VLTYSNPDYCVAGDPPAKKKQRWNGKIVVPGGEEKEKERQANQAPDGPFLYYDQRKKEEREENHK